MAYWSCDLPPELLVAGVERWAALYFGTSYTPVRLVGSIASKDPFEAECLDLSDAADLTGMSSEAAARTVLDRCAEIYERFAEWPHLYSHEELNRGLWRMFSHPGWIGDLLLDESLPFAPRDRVIRSLETPYLTYVARLGPGEPMENGWYMLWDLLFSYKQPSLDLATAALRSLERILAVPDDRCRWAALHGLNHLAHPDRPAVVQRYIDRYETVETLSILEAMRDGNAM